MKVYIDFGRNIMRKFTQIFSTLFIMLFGFACARQDALYKAIEAGDTQQVAQ